MSINKDEVASSDYKLDKAGKKIKAQRIVFNKGEDDGKKGISEMKKKYKDFAEQHSIAEALHPEANKVLKHIKPEHHDKYKADLAKGVYKGDFADRTAVLKAAQNAGHLKEETIEEAFYADDYTATSEKSHFGGHRPHVVNKKTGNTMHLSAHAYKSPEHAKAHAKAYLNAYAKNGSNAADSAGHNYAKANADKRVVKEEAELEEGWDDMLAHAKKVATTSKTSTSTKHDVKKTSTGTVYTKQRDADGNSKEFKRDTDQAKRGRGRPKKNSFGEAVEFLMGLDEEAFDSMMEEGFDSFMEEFEQLNELDKKTLGSYVKKATNGMSGVAINAHQAGGAAPGSAERKTFLAKANKRIGGIAKAADRLSK